MKLGNSDITLKVGSVNVDAAYIGTTLVYSASTPSFNGKWLATYTAGTTSSAECDSTSAITQNEITLTDLQSLIVGDCVTSIGDSAFTNCNTLTSIDIPSSVTSIGSYTFRNCTSLTSIDIPSGVTSIGSHTFNGCSGLTSIDIPSGVTGIGNSAFLYCTSLTSIDIPSSVTSIGSYTFRNCTSLTSCTIGSGVRSIGSSAFSYCSGLTSITVNAETPPLLGGHALDYTNDCPIYVPAESVETYKSVSGWNTFASRIRAIP